MSYNPHAQTQQQVYATQPQPAQHPQQPQHLPGPPSPESPTTGTSSRKRPRPAELDMDPNSGEYKDAYYPPASGHGGYYDTSGGAAADLGGMVPPPSAGGAGGEGTFTMEHGDADEDEDDEDMPRTARAAASDANKAGRRKIKIEFIQDKSRRHITFSKRKAGIMKKAYELSTLTGTQVLLLVVSETGLVYTFTTAKLQPLVTQPEGKNLIQACLNAPTSQGPSNNSNPTSGPPGPGPGPPGSGAGAGGGGGSGSRGGGVGGGPGRNVPGGLNIGGGGGPADASDSNRDVSSDAPHLELDPTSSPTAGFHPPPPGSAPQHYYAAPPRSVSSSTAASNSSPALTHASPNLANVNANGDMKRARRRTEVATDVSMGVQVNASGMRRNTLPVSAAEQPSEEGVVPSGIPAGSGPTSPEYGTGTPPTGHHQQPRAYAQPAEGGEWAGYPPHHPGQQNMPYPPPPTGYAHPLPVGGPAGVQPSWNEYGRR